MAAKKAETPCMVCNPADARAGDYCERHREELHRLDHQYQRLFRLQRLSRGKDHETYNLFFQDDCDPCGRVFVAETDPDNLSLVVLVSADLNLDSRITEYASFGIEKTYGDQLRARIQREIIHSWYGNARACVDVYRTTVEQPQHWDVDSRERAGEDEDAEVEPPPGGKHSVH